MAAKKAPSTDSVEIVVVKSAPWLRRTALVVALLGILRAFLIWPAHSLSWKLLPNDIAMSWLWTDLAVCFWIAGSGFLLGFLAEAATRGEAWAGPFARGVANLLLCVGLMGCALGWSNPVAWAVLFLAVLARMFAAS
jgi:hypothetical protein